jgi:hypothetical protein
MDSVILVHKIIHSLKSTRTPGMLLKLDLSKAFDKLSWHYIKVVLMAFGFSTNWTDWIMNLITSTFFSILVNGTPSQAFSPSRGIRQGDPLSPFLFIIMVEGLGRYIKASLFALHILGFSWFAHLLCIFLVSLFPLRTLGLLICSAYSFEKVVSWFPYYMFCFLVSMFSLHKIHLIT